MPNMHYCRAENTLADLQQILGEAESEGILETFREGSREEKAAAVALFDACRAYIELFEYATEEPDYEDVFRSYPYTIGAEA